MCVCVCVCVCVWFNLTTRVLEGQGAFCCTHGSLVTRKFYWQFASINSHMHTIQFKILFLFVRKGREGGGGRGLRRTV